MNNDPDKLTPEQKLLAIQGLDPFENESGLRCPKCGCADMRVRNTIQYDDSVRRYRVCRHCGTARRTSETFG